MSESKTLEDLVKQAELSLLKAKRDLAIKEFIETQLTDENGEVIETEIHFEFGKLKIDIGKKRVRQSNEDGGTSRRSSNQKSKKRIHRSQEQKNEIFKKCLTTSFTGLKRADAVLALQKVAPNFTNGLWIEFSKSSIIKGKLTKEGETRNMVYTFNVATESKSASKPTKAKKITVKKAAPKKAAPKKAAPKKAAPSTKKTSSTKKTTRKSTKSK